MFIYVSLFFTEYYKDYTQCLVDICGVQINNRSNVIWRKIRLNRIPIFMNKLYEKKYIFNAFYSPDKYLKNALIFKITFQIPSTRL